MPFHNVLICLFLLSGIVISYTTRKLTLTGAITGGLVGLLIYKGAGYGGLLMMSFFFIAGSWATGWHRQDKLAVVAAENDKGPRTAGQVLANGGVAAILGAIAWYMPQHAILMQLMIAGSLASATADTLSSELGMVYGRNFYHILTFKKDQRGLDGVVSLEGTLIGVLGACFVAIIYALFFGWGWPVCWIIVAGTIGNLADSVLGAALERKHLIGNNLVNFLNTLIGAVVCGMLMYLVKT
jgi:uncharacterized protein (TIGR00297 family)